MGGERTLFTYVPAGETLTRHKAGMDGPAEAGPSRFRGRTS
jgi:hypothetical protein